MLQTVAGARATEELRGKAWRVAQEVISYAGQFGVQGLESFVFGDKSTDERGENE